MKRSHQYMLGGVAVLALIATTAVAASYATRSTMEPSPTQQARIQTQPTSHTTHQHATPPCDDHNIVGTVGGGVAGGLLGAQFGSGNGRTAATTVGILGGAALGNRYMPTHGATCG